MKKILIADDDESIVEMVRTILEEAGHNVEVAYDGEDALKKIGQKKPDLAILDVMMPKIDGFNLNQELKDEPSTRDIPVIIMTGWSGTKHIFEKTKNSRVKGLIEKPFKEDKLINMVDSVLR